MTPVEKSISSRVIRRGEGDPGEFDRAFWAGLGPETRLGVAWEMVLEAMAIKGRNDVEQGLQRAVEAVHRPRR